jgi:diguanylate cyclase (GGDEF)-like protein
MVNIAFANNKTIVASKKVIYKVMIVDDEPSVHDISNIALKSMEFQDFDIEVLSAYSSIEAKEIILKTPDISLALIDVVMETPEAGLDLVNYIRQEVKNNIIRLIIRTGQANELPEMEVIQKYDINDFKEKSEFTIERLYTSVRTSIKQYIQLIELEKKFMDTYLQMTTNSLTKLYNRNKLYEDCNDNKQKDKTLILVDIVNFSHINETHGYEVGDYVLCTLGKFLVDKFGEEFVVYHLDNDLFALVTIVEYHDNLINFVFVLKEEISKLHIQMNSFDSSIDTNIGVSQEYGNSLIRKAELALKESREKVAEDITFYSDDLKIIKRLNSVNLWNPIIKNAMLKGNLFPYYQPIVDLTTKEIIRYEALVRLEHEGKLCNPDEFLDAAKHSGQLYSIFKVMFEISCKKIQDSNQKLSVNIDSNELGENDLIEFIKEMIWKYGIDTSLLSLELLEHTSINDESKKILLDIHDLGIEIIIDDFGINCSNFGQLEGLPISTLKIDGSFIKDIVHSKDKQIIIKAIKTFTDEKDIKLVAEYVCNKDVYDMVKSLGIDYGQGYYLGKPEKELIY